MVDDLSNWYVRLNRARFWAPDTEADAAAVATLHEALVTTARLLAPAAPFASDWLHTRARGELGAPRAVSRPMPAGSMPGLDVAMDAVRRLASLGRAARETATLRVRQPLARMKVAVPAGVQGAEFDGTAATAAARRPTSRRSRWWRPTRISCGCARKPNFRTLGKRFGADVKAVAAWIGTLPPEAMQQLEQGRSFTGSRDGVVTELLPEDVIVEREVVTDWPVASEGPFVVALDPVVTPALASEGLARELVSRLQRLRKDAGYDVTTASPSRSRATPPCSTRRADTASTSPARRWRASSSWASALPDADRREAVEIDERAAVLSTRRLGDGRTLSGPAQTDEQ